MVVAELLRWRAPMALILIVLLLGFNPLLEQREDNDYVEIFAGAGEISGRLRQDGAGGSAMDLLWNPMVFDLTTDVGFSLALNEVRRLRPGGVCVIALCCSSFSSMWLACHFLRV
ncbi:unnamed protein product [Symbiodinium pilosum]|uniref:Uncharacterized protein n=1 Tax=Symbiodinium pilosum TaxID=2952 RepID=A0A812LN17_SYMPI|nr:unnamed protein product [Symbiodinium pilosum]